MGIIALVFWGVVWYFVTDLTVSWIRQIVAAVVVGVIIAALRYGSVLEMADILDIRPRSFPSYAFLVIGGQVIVALAAMGLRRYIDRAK